MAHNVLVEALLALKKGSEENHLKSSLIRSPQDNRCEDTCDGLDTAVDVLKSFKTCYVSSLACGFVHFSRGNWEQAEAFLLDGIALAKQQGHVSRALYKAHWRLTQIHKRNGNLQQALVHLRIAAHGNLPVAQTAFGLMQFNSGSSRESQVEALDWIERAANLNEPKAQRLLAKWYLSGQGPLVRNDAEALHWLSLSAASGDVKSLRTLCETLESNLNGTPEAVRYAHATSASYGDANSLFWLYQRCKGIDCACQGKENLLRGSARLGHALAMFHLGLHLLLNGPLTSVSEALCWLFLCAHTARQRGEAKLALRAKYCLGVSLLLLNKRFTSDECQLKVCFSKD